MAELSLAIVPLVISALQHYSTVRQTISRYRNFSEHVEEFFAELDVQCRIFQTSVQLLLIAEVADGQATRMLENENDVGWTDPDLDAHLCKRFSSRNILSLKSSLFLIRRQIKKLLNVSGLLPDITDEAQAVRTCYLGPRKGDLTLFKDKPSLTDKVRQLGKRIDLACSQGRTETLLRILRERTEDFRVLVQQTERLVDGRVPKEPSPFAKAQVKRFATIKSAANNLYSAVGQACTKHTVHQGYIGLQPTYNGTDNVHFVLAFRSLRTQITPSLPGSIAQDVIWLTVKSETTGDVHPPESDSILESLNKSAKRARAASPSRLRKLKDMAIAKRRKEHKKEVSFRPDPLLDHQLSRSPSAVTIVEQSNSLVNLCGHKNLCDKMRNIFKQSSPFAGQCIGYFDVSGDSRHLVYIHSRMDKVNTAGATNAMMALSELLGETHPGESLTLHRKFHIGRQLALALLQFHETCWVKEFWSSEDIMVMETPKPSLEMASRTANPAQEPYASVSIRGEEPAARQLRSQPMPYIRNRALFNLGKVLLELAFEQRFTCLKQADDAGQGLAADSEEFFAAERLVLSVSEKLGSRFAEVVRKCIKCDFGQGDDLASTRLQAGFYQDVICELETCEQRVQDL